MFLCDDFFLWPNWDFFTEIGKNKSYFRLGMGPKFEWGRILDQNFGPAGMAENPVNRERAFFHQRGAIRYQKGLYP